MPKCILAVLALTFHTILAAGGAAEGQACGVFGLAGDIPVTGDWNGDGKDEIGIFRPSAGIFQLDYNGNGVWNGSAVDRQVVFGSAADTPVVGDWNGDGRDKIGVFVGGPTFWTFYLDHNGNGVWDGCVSDRCARYGLQSDQPVIGDWNGDGIDEIGVFRDWLWDIDLDGNLRWDGPPADRSSVFGLEGDIGVPGDWDGDGRDEIAVYRPTVWSLDLNDNGVWDGIGPDGAFNFGNGDETPVVGDWDGDGTDTAGMFSEGAWYWDGCSLPPVAVDDEATTSANTPILIDVVANDYDPHQLSLRLAQIPDPIVVAPSNGTATRHNDDYIRYTPDPGFAGEDSFVYRVTATDQETDQGTVTVNVTPLPGPDITLVNRRTIPLSGQTTIKIRGRNMANAMVRIPDPENDDQVAPRVVSISHIPVNEQHRFDIVLDTSDPQTEGIFTILIENEAGLDAAAVEDVRVVPNRPVVDLYTPSVAVDGSAYVMMVAGANLLNANVSASHPSIAISELDVTHDSMLTGLLVVENGSPPGNFDLTLGVPGGGSVSLPIELPAQQELPTGIKVTEIAEGNKKGMPVYLQEPTFVELGANAPKVTSSKPSALTKSPSGPGSVAGSPPGKFNACVFPDTLLRFRGSRSEFEIRVLPLDPTGSVNPGALAAMEVGEVRFLGAGAYALVGIVSVLAEVNYCPETGEYSFDVCVVVDVGVEALGGPGQIITSVACTTGLGFTQFELTNGTLDFFLFRSPELCTDIQSTGGPPPPLGPLTTNVELTDCCDETVLYSTGGTAFGGSALEIPYTALGQPIATATCGSGGPTIGAINIEVRNFIPRNHLTTSETCPASFVVLYGDDRSYDPNPPVNIAQTNSFRVEHSVSVMPSASECQSASNCTGEGLVVGSKRIKWGRADFFGFDALENAPPSTITAEDFDDELGDCHLWEGSAVHDSHIGEIAVKRVDDDTVSVVSNELTTANSEYGPPETRWSFEIEVHDDGTYSIEGNHSCYPAHEVYIDGEQVWGSMPTDHSWENWQCCASNSPVMDSCEGGIGDPNPCFLKPIILPCSAGG